MSVPRHALWDLCEERWADAGGSEGGAASAFLDLDEASISPYLPIPPHTSPISPAYLPHISLPSSWTRRRFARPAHNALQHTRAHGAL